MLTREGQEIFGLQCPEALHHQPLRGKTNSAQNLRNSISMHHLRHQRQLGLVRVKQADVCGDPSASPPKGTKDSPASESTPASKKERTQSQVMGT